MQTLVCELCGSNNVVKQDGVYVCQHCGTKYSVEDAKKIMGVVSIDRTEETENLLMLARRARDENNAGNAAKYYGQVLQNDPTNWEASFYQVYYQSMGCTIMLISSAAHAVANNIKGTVSLIHEHEQPDKQKAALTEVINRSSYIAYMLASAAIGHYNAHSTVNGISNECSTRVVAVSSIYTQLEDSIKKEYGNKHECMLSVQKDYVGFVSRNAKWFNTDYRKNVITRLTNEIKQADPNYTPPEVKAGGCYIATCVYGSYDCPSVWTLRRYRDNTLAANWYGRIFIRTYYAISPHLVKWFGTSKWFRGTWETILDKMIKKLREQGITDTPYQDKNW